MNMHPFRSAAAPALMPPGKWRVVVGCAACGLACEAGRDVYYCASFWRARLCAWYWLLRLPWCPVRVEYFIG
jgi:hypothetical protein